MEAWIDIIFIAIIVIFAIVGLVKGLFESILSLCASIASIFLAFWASQPVAEFLNRVADANKFFQKFLQETVKVPAEGLGGRTLDQLASICTVVLSMVIVYVLIKVAVWLLTRLFDSVTANSTPLSGMNRLLGLVFGAAQGFAVGLMVLGMAAIMAFVPKLGTNINNYLDQNSNFTLKTYHYVQEWVEDELKDSIDDFIDELAEKAPVTVEKDETDYAKAAYEEINNTDLTDLVEDYSITYVLPTTVNMGENIVVNVSAWGHGYTINGSYQLATNPGQINEVDLIPGTYTFEFENVKFELGTEGQEGYQTYSGNVVFTVTIA